MQKSFTEVLSRAMESRVSDIFTASPARVVEYYPETRTADVLPTVRRPVPTVDDGIAFEEYPIIPNVPVCFPLGGGVSIEWPIAKGDHVLIVATTHAIGQWRATGEVSDALDIRGHHPGSVVAIPSLAPNSATGRALDGLVVTADDIRLGSRDASEFAALAAKVDANFEALKNAIDSAVAVPNDGGAAILATLKSGVAAFTDTACQKVRIE